MGIFPILMVCISVAAVTAAGGASRSRATGELTLGLLSGERQSGCTLIFCGSWLACDGGGTFNITLTDPPLSRASPLPQDLCRTQILYIPAPPVGASLLAMLLILLLLLLWLLILICCPFPRGRTQALRRGHRGKDAAVAAPGHGWPMAAGPRSNAFVMACRA